MPAGGRGSTFIIPVSAFSSPLTKIVPDVEKGATDWTVGERDYPADSGKVRKLLLDLAALSVVEEKTRIPENYPALGVEAVRSVPPQNRGLAMGAYTAFLDVALGFGTPVLGFLAERAGLGSAFAVSTLAALGTAAIAGFLLSSRRVPRAASSAAL